MTKRSRTKKPCGGDKSPQNDLSIAIRYHQSGQWAEAKAVLQRLLQSHPAEVDAIHLLGVLAAEQGQYETAIAHFHQAIAITPTQAIFHSNLGNTFLQCGLLSEAIARYLQALKLDPNYTLARKNLAITCERQLDSGIAHQQAGRLVEAETCYQDVLQGQPERADAWHLLGLLASEREQYESAIEKIKRSTTLKPNAANFYNSLGTVYCKQRDFVNAIECYQQAIKLQPDLLIALQNMGQIYYQQKNFVEAEAVYRKVLAINPDSLELLSLQGTLLKDTGRSTEAEAAYRKLLTIRPDDCQVNFKLGNLLVSQKRLHEAEACYKQVLSVQEGFLQALGMLAYCHALMCDWSRYAETRKRLSMAVQEGILCVTPFIFLNFSDDPFELLTCAKIRANNKFYSVSNVQKIPMYRHKKIRLAYVSPDFKKHPVAYLIADLIERHDRSLFEVIGVSIGPPSGDKWRKRLEQGFDQFLDVQGLSTETVLGKMRDLEIDIAVDLAGYTTHSRPEIFARRLAPVQVNYLGFPGTIGADFIDYLIADRFVIPEALQSAYSEKIVYLPDTFQSAATRQIAETLPSRTAYGLPEKGFVFCCFNNSYKFHPPVFDVWMRLLAQVENSVLWLLKENDAVEKNLRSEAQIRGISPDRLVFAPRKPLPEYLASYRHADLFLDAFPYNAGTTASDALWVGLPLVTCAGRTFVSRMAGSLLLAAGLPELITENLEDYEARALHFATHPDDLAALNQKLIKHRTSHPLFDVERFRRHIEAAYQTMWETWQRGEATKAFAIEPIEASSAASAEGAITGHYLSETPEPKTIENVSELIPEQMKKKNLLHVGCGPARIEKLPRFFHNPEWQEIRLDINAACQPDIVASMTSMPQVADDSMAALFSSHNLEHLYPHEVPLALKEFRRVLDEFGFVLITLPDLQSVAELVAQDKLEDTAYVSPAGPIAPVDILYGHRASLERGNLFMAHRTGFTAKTLTNAFLLAGFAQVAVQRDGRFGLWALAFKKEQSEEKLGMMSKALFPL
ncbi:putative O-linked N-acetylglucosamine transferase (SPINDLY family) [Nitrosomonas sp. Nm84]|uniref:O-linked N-acetylglucosamine transferase family protein n=1 Tax=Nitrosomonas sp. Nm84 TaxID=200124 RepID=UPI000D76384E|nr:tetratricopeptide repeat protein [Nitrosomonas sp. Nm84]PXW83906.1 putative O-linked N-acetylglucosamine transferase (SPINDLY family) [Nitrosomonas sp. Nm84]